jgi:surface antigen Omp85-like protein
MTQPDMVRALAYMAVFCAVAASSAFAQTPSPVSVYGVVPGDPTGAQGVSSIEQAVPTAVDPTETPKRAELVIAPIPIINPTIENGLAVLGGYLYRLDASDKTTPPSASGVLGFKTTNGSWGAAFVQSLHLSHDKFRLLGVGAYGDVNYAFYGIGQSAGDAGLSIGLNQAGPAGMVEGLVHLGRRWYAGARYFALHMAVTSPEIPIPGGPTLPGVDADIRTASLGPRVDFDSRDNPFYATRGTQLQSIIGLYGEGVGGHRSYQSYQGALNRYHAIGRRSVLAWHASGCGIAGDAPFYDLCLLGKAQDLRGYTLGQYRDRAMLAAQAEWRSELWWRFGATAFFGEGLVAPDFGSFTADGLLPGGGVGLRFTVATQNHVNLRVDYAWGKNSSALYMGVAEAF